MEKISIDNKNTFKNNKNIKIEENIKPIQKPISLSDLKNNLNIKKKHLISHQKKHLKKEIITKIFYLKVKMSKNESIKIK